MSGIFRSTSLNNTSHSTPQKRYSFGAFCTSPSTLKDVTMEHPYGVGFPCVSLQGHGVSSPPVQGRSVREFEEQMASLRKENFNLKLRLYFLEESVPGYHQSNAEGPESLMKQLIDTKVEIEILRKELEEKQDLLKEAAQAMNHMEQIQKETETKGQAFIDELKQKIQFLEMERDLDKTHHSGFMNDLLGHSDISENVNALQKIRELEGMVTQCEGKMHALQMQNSKLEEIIAKRDEAIKEYEEKVKELAFQNAELLETMENKEKEMATAELNLKSLRLTNAKLKEGNNNLIRVLKITEENYHKEFSNTKVCEKRMREQQDALSKMQLELREKKMQLADKLCELDDAQEELKKLRKSYDTACRTLQQLLQREKSLQDSGSRTLSDSEALQNSAQKCDHEKTIKSLESEVKKKTAALQNLVNNELWQKNREIERLTKFINANTTSPLSPTAVRKNLESLQLQQSFTETDYTKALEHNKLLQRKVDVLNQRLVSERTNDALIEELRREARTARAEADNAETCRRAYAKVFVALSDRLYELAGFLNSLMKNKEVLSFLSTERRRAMRTAVDCSLDLSTSIRESLTIGEQSFEGISNLSRLLMDDEERESCLVSKTHNSQEQFRGRQSFDVLRSENRALRKILDGRRSCGGADYAKDAKERRSLPPFLLDNLSESEAWSEPDRQVSMARIGLEEHATTAAAATAKDSATKQTPPTAETDSESESDVLQQSRTMKLRNQERIAQLEKQIAQRDDRILMIQFQLVEADNNLKKESLRATSLTQEIEQLRHRNEELLTDLISIGGEQSKDGTAMSESSQLNNSLLQRQIDEKCRVIEQLQEERDRITVEARLAEVQVGALKADIEDIKQKYEIQLKLASEKERQHLDELKNELEQLMQQRLKEQERVHKETLTREWVARTTYDDCRTQLTNMQSRYIESERTIEYLTDNEQDLKRALITSEMEIRGLKKQLDESVLQASKVVTERTKLCNEKLQLEKRLMELQQQLSAAGTLQEETKKRVTALERLQQTLNEQIQQSQIAAENRPNASDTSPSGYASDDVQKSSTKRDSNSSPDLGIHSDTGRVSSLEMSHMQRSLLKTVTVPEAASELAANEDTTYSIQDKKHISNLAANKRVQHSLSSDLGIDSDAGRTRSADAKKESPGSAETDDSNTENKMSVANVNTSNANTSGTSGTMPIHDCIKVEQENAELRRKLAQTKRAFEDTYKKLHISNKRKENFEKEVKEQILKTKNTLKYARFHMSKVQPPLNAQHHHQQEQPQSTHQAHHQQTQQQQQRNVTNVDDGDNTTKSSSDAPH
ncbi:centrosomin isoform X3 [Anastrepha ludens]|uniref:centrosomin isoform X3 n=1 Tax=Anastrepha ludens TaxID=28586 RepID=UPI0023AE6CD6|nr:centrosomin isoform X3 [Anastrepha ludens]XP_053963931.1 centrosomin isoform X3 [Anastrepha ludens]XP_053963932.1 centrosomin isoform X3 [Anastrepha ludens]XP_053963933.1 centrosomin isoform X3 [Anastrepha ludens]